VPLCSKIENNPIANEKFDAHVLKLGFFMGVAKTFPPITEFNNFFYFFSFLHPSQHFLGS
jgi:hypothetical protein